MARESFGFTGYFTSDCDAVYEIEHGHHWQPPEAPAPLDQFGRSAFANSAGEDLECNAGYSDQFNYGNTIPTALSQHIATQTDVYNVGDVDTSLVRLFAARIETGEFDSESRVPWVARARAELGGVQWVDSDANKAETETPARLAAGPRGGRSEHRAAEELVPSGGQSPLLPLKVPHSGPYKVAVMGFFANPPGAMYLGGYSSIQAALGSGEGGQCAPGDQVRRPGDRPGRHRRLPAGCHRRDDRREPDHRRPSLDRRRPPATTPSSSWPARTRPRRPSRWTAPISNCRAPKPR